MLHNLSNLRHFGRDSLQSNHSNKGVLNGNSKNWGLANFWPDLEILQAYLMGLEVSFLGDLCLSES